MSINNKDYFDDDFEVIYEEDLSDLLFEDEENDYNDEKYYNHDSDRDSGRKRRNSDSGQHDSVNETRKKKKRGVPNLISPAAKTAKAGGKAIYKIINLLLRAATLILIALVTYTLGISFWNHHSAYGNILRVVNEKNYILGAYAAVALFLLLFEIITFLLVLFGSKNGVRNGNPADKGRGLFSFIFIYAGSLLAGLFCWMIPGTPAPLQGAQGALSVYGSLCSALLPLCLAGVISCLIRKFIIR